MRWILLFSVAAITAACGSQSTTPSAAEGESELPGGNFGEGIQTMLTSAGVRTATVTADSAYAHLEEQRTDFLGVRVIFYDELGGESGTVTSRRADYDVGRGAFIANGDVVLVTEGPNGERRLETEQLIYDLDADSLSTNEPFTLHENGRVTTGTSFRSDSKFRTWEVTGAKTEDTVSGGTRSF